MNIDIEGVWHCDNCDFSGNFDEVKKHEDAVKFAKDYLEKIKS